MADDFQSNIIITSIPLIKRRFPQLLIICDVCLCPYTDHGHCGILDPSTQRLDLQESKKRIAEIALAYAKAGADIVAPSDMMEGRIENISAALESNSLRSKVPSLSTLLGFLSFSFL